MSFWHIFGTVRRSYGNHPQKGSYQWHVAKYRDDRLADKWRGKPITGSTVKKELNMLSRLFGYAEIEEGIDLPRGNPVRKVRMPKDGTGRDRRLTEEEWKRLESECRASRNRSLWPCVQLAIALGARQGELLNP